MLIASDDRNNEFQGARNPDDVLHVVFYMRSMQNNFQTEKEGRPIFRDEMWVKIMIPGRTDTELDIPATEQHKQRFPRQWMIFQNKQENMEGVQGTPVTEWPALTKSQAEELKGQKFYTVEQVANCSDGQIQALGMNANILRQKARAFLASAKDSALAQQQAAELEQKNAEIAALKQSQQELAEQMTKMNAAMAQLAAGVGNKKKPKSTMSPEQRKAVGERLKAGRLAKASKAAEPPPEPVNG